MLFQKNLTRIQTPSHEKFFPKPNLFCSAYHSLGGICHIYQATAQLTAQNKISTIINLLCHLKKQMNHRSMLEQLKPGNYTAMQL
jgi:nitric oxide reductase activation protein